MNPGDQITHETRRGEEAVTAFSICTNQSCLTEREVPAVKGTVSQMGHDVFARMALVETHHLSADDSVFSCEECGSPCILSEKPRREIPSLGYAHPQSQAWQRAREARSGA